MFIYVFARTVEIFVLKKQDKEFVLLFEYNFSIVLETDDVIVKILDTVILKLINNSSSDKPIRIRQFGQVRVV